MNKKNLVLSLALLSSSIAFADEAPKAPAAVAAPAAPEAPKASEAPATAPTTGTNAPAATKGVWATISAMPKDSYNAVMANKTLAAVCILTGVVATIAIQALVNKSSDVDAEEAL